MADNNTCPSCGGKLTPDASFCPSCGAELKGSAESRPRKKSGNWREPAIIAGAIIILSVIYIAFFSGEKKEPVPPEQAANQENFQHPQIPGLPAGTQPDYNQIVANLPKSYDSLVQVGNHFMDNQVFALAIECYTRALAIDSSNPDIYTDLGACYYSTEQDQKALDAFQKAITLDPRHAVAHFNMGIVYRSMNNIEKTKEFWNKFLILEPQSPIADSVRKYLAEMDKK
ncbi:hypothetical protein TRIP_C60350 [Candidatus Zixiibacteriota bacterium]|nr:hypothetical protein TRIP_C60350 [candidate division Zixibacteria bacterium]